MMSRSCEEFVTEQGEYYLRALPECFTPNGEAHWRGFVPHKNDPTQSVSGARSTKQTPGGLATERRESGRNVEGVWSIRISAIVARGLEAVDDTGCPESVPTGHTYIPMTVDVLERLNAQHDEIGTWLAQIAIREL